ncbi:hypothetical protein [Schlesneria sp. DSM 10557]|uniref:hypothetical protein n=1 Tax=Schlesneria sp. DSM 10557 TaxID=3044399 RepID=UPI00359F4250
MARSMVQHACLRGPGSLLYIGLLLLPRSVCQAEPPALAEAITALDNWRAAFNSIHITYEIDEGVIEEPPRGPLLTVGEYYWSDAKRFYWHDQQFRDRKMLGQNLIWRDSFISGWARFPSGEDQEKVPPTSIEFGRTVNGGFNGIQGLIVTTLHGLWQPQTCCWLPELLKKQQLSSRVITAEGAPCLELTYQNQMETDPTTLVLDPRYGYLPRSVLSGWETQFSEFQQFPPGIWMPTAGVFDIIEQKKSWKLTSVVFNQGIEDEKVSIPEPGEGTLMIDRVQGSVWIHGTPPIVLEPKEEDENDHRQGDGRCGGPGSLVNGVGKPLPVWLVVLGSVSLFVGTLVSRARELF